MNQKNIIPMQDEDLTVYVARICAGMGKEIDDARYQTRVRHLETRENSERWNSSYTRHLAFMASPYGDFPTGLFVEDESKSDSFMAALDMLFVKAQANKATGSGIGFIADGALATERAQVALISRIAGLFFREREDLAAMPWQQFEDLAVEMHQKGVMLVYRHWCEQTVFDARFEPLFNEIVKCLSRARP